MIGDWRLHFCAAFLLVTSGCSTFPHRDGHRTDQWTESTTGPFIVETSAGAAERRAVAASLVELEDRVGRVLGMTVPIGTPPIRVLVLDDEEQLARLMRSTHPELPRRRAFFLSEGDRRTIYASRGDRLTEDLQHEATHALLSACVGPLPLWLDEGLAEYFEVDPRHPEEVDRRIDALLAERTQGWQPNLSRLESIESIGGLTARDYREAWAWTRMMLEGSPAMQTILARTLNQVETPKQGIVLVSHTLGADHSRQASAFWDSLEARRGEREEVEVRAQSIEGPPRPVVEEPPRRSRWGFGAFAARLGRAMFGP